MSDPRDFLTYDPNTGDFFWKVRSGRMTPGSRAGKTTRLGYRMLLVKGKHHQAHRAAWLFHYGEWPDGQIDHINRDPGDNRIDNLRVVTGSENCRNKHHPSSSGYRGVTFHKKTQKWQASACLPHEKPRYLGLFETPEEASEAYTEFMGRHGL